MIKFSCACGQHMAAAPQHIGKTVACPACGKPSNVPRPSATATATITASSHPHQKPVRIACPSCQTADWVSPAALGGTVSCSKCSYEYLAEECPIEARPPAQALQGALPAAALAQGGKVAIDWSKFTFSDAVHLAWLMMLANFLVGLVIGLVFFLVFLAVATTGLVAFR